MWRRLKNRTDIKVIITNHINGGSIRVVYDTGNGPFVYDYMGSTPRYMKRDGSFEVPEYRMCNGDPASWRAHLGEVDSLDWKDCIPGK